VFLVAGLGNPGSEYEKTRHNVGFMVADQLAAMYRTKIKLVQSQALIAKIERVASPSFILAKPFTYMNLSGNSVFQLLKKFNFSPQQLIVIHDDLDLDTGNVQIKKGGSIAGHRGLRSIVERLGTMDFIRIRIGIGRPAEKDDIVEYVLTPFRSSERALIEEAIALSVNIVLDCLDYGFDYTAIKYPRKKNSTQ